MPPKSKARAARMQEVASDSEDDLMNSETENQRPATKASAKAKGTATMPRRASGATATKRKPAARTTQKRQALKDRTNLPAASDAEDVEEADEDEQPAKKTKRAKPAATRKPAAKSKKELNYIPETQPDPEEMEDVEQSVEVDPNKMDVSLVPTPKKLQPFVQRPRSTSVQPLAPRPSERAASAQPLQAYPSARSASAQPLQPRPSARSASAQPGYHLSRERSGSVSDTARERRGMDPDLRRRLNDMENKFDALRVKYQNLQEIAKGNADSNFEQLKRASDQKARDAEALIQSMKREIAELKKASTASTKESAKESAEMAKMKQQVTSLTATNTTLSTANAALTSERDGAKASLLLAQNEVKALDAKLVAARQQLSSSNAAQEKAAHAKENLGRSVGPAANEAQKEAKMKENLYSDLTGLIIRGVKRKDGEDEYDCIQTGRNGSKFFSSTPTSRVKKLT